MNRKNMHLVFGLLVLALVFQDSFGAAAKIRLSERAAEIQRQRAGGLEHSIKKAPRFITGSSRPHDPLTWTQKDHAAEAAAIKAKHSFASLFSFTKSGQALRGHKEMLEKKSVPANKAMFDDFVAERDLHTTKYKLMLKRQKNAELKGDTAKKEKLTKKIATHQSAFNQAYGVDPNAVLKHATPMELASKGREAVDARKQIEAKQELLSAADRRAWTAEQIARDKVATERAKVAQKAAIEKQKRAKLLENAALEKIAQQNARDAKRSAELHGTVGAVKSAVIGAVVDAQGRHMKSTLGIGAGKRKGN